MKQIKNESVDRLFEAILTLKNTEECYELFQDLCTVKEIESMAQRLDTAILLNDGENYTDVEKKANVSSATISRVSRCLQYGTGGYKKIIERLEKKK